MARTAKRQNLSPRPHCACVSPSVYRCLCVRACLRARFFVSVFAPTHASLCESCARALTSDPRRQQRRPTPPRAARPPHASPAEPSAPPVPSSSALSRADRAGIAGPSPVPKMATRFSRQSAASGPCHQSCCASLRTDVARSRRNVRAFSWNNGKGKSRQRTQHAWPSPALPPLLAANATSTAALLLLRAPECTRIPGGRAGTLPASRQEAGPAARLPAACGSARTGPFPACSESR